LLTHYFRHFASQTIQSSKALQSEITLPYGKSGQDSGNATMKIAQKTLRLFLNLKVQHMGTLLTPHTPIRDPILKALTTRLDFPILCINLNDQSEKQFLQGTTALAPKSYLLSHNDKVFILYK
jgi:hypothetical protein